MIRGALCLAAATVAIIGGPGRIARVAKKQRGSMAGAIGGNIVLGSEGTTSIDMDWSTVLSSASIAVGWTGVDSSISTGARVDISSSVSFKKSVICVAVALR
uniref:Uncharacterized protein n=1 Tax=Romanomermis culicivorax TaxID=13658 RepID=A0A915L6A6_ROMCU